jgi:hypothetical protein
MTQDTGVDTTLVTRNDGQDPCGSGGFWRLDEWKTGVNGRPYSGQDLITTYYFTTWNLNTRFNQYWLVPYVYYRWNRAGCSLSDHHNIIDTQPESNPNCTLYDIRNGCKWDLSARAFPYAQKAVSWPNGDSTTPIQYQLDPTNEAQEDHVPNALSWYADVCGSTACFLNTPATLMSWSQAIYTGYRTIRLGDGTVRDGETWGMEWIEGDVDDPNNQWLEFMYFLSGVGNYHHYEKAIQNGIVVNGPTWQWLKTYGDY